MLADKTIKLWKVFEKSLRVVAESNMGDGQRALPPPSLGQHLRLPRMQHQDNIIAAVPRKVYSNAHAYHIHSITVNSDQETYISADDLRVNLWNLNISDQSFSQLFSLNATFHPNVSPLRHCGHQTSKHGGAHRGYHGC
jgi:serine/threonine-protein phosphatase 2A regulatory subunit B